MSRLTVQEIEQYFSYDPITGVVTWKQSPNQRIRIGRTAGKKVRDGRNTYIATTLGGRAIYAHQIALALTFGRIPRCTDHINGDGTDNRLANIREVTHRENARNKRRSIKNKSGATGVYRSRGKWRASIRADNGKTVTLGRFVHFDDAVAARKSAEISYGFHPNHGRAE